MMSPRLYATHRAAGMVSLGSWLFCLAGASIFGVLLVHCGAMFAQLGLADVAFVLLSIAALPVLLAAASVAADLVLWPTTWFTCGARTYRQISPQEDPLAPSPAAPNHVECVVAQSVSLVREVGDASPLGEGRPALRFVKVLPPPIGDRELQSLAPMIHLKWLILDNTDISDAGLKHLQSLRELRRIYARGTNVTTEGVRDLRRSLPNVQVTI